jgi:hypothetical protein
MRSSASGAASEIAAAIRSWAKTRGGGIDSALATCGPRKLQPVLLEFAQRRRPIDEPVDSGKNIGPLKHAE